MLAVAHPRGADHGDGCLEDFGAGGDNFSDAFSGGDLQLEDIDFDDIFVGFDETDDLQDLQVEPLEIFGAISADGSSPEQSATTSSAEAKSGDAEEATTGIRELEEDGCLMGTAAAGEGDCKAPPKASQAKKKVKVDWTPELHRRFVQAVEQLGIDKAVPSKILEIMGIEGLTRHNIASHLQKYRSHRKHLLSREAEAATWSQRRRMYGGGSGAQGGCSGVAAKRVSPTPWLAPTMGFPPPPPMHHFRQLHVWGHPTADHAMMHMWPRQPLVASRPHLAHWPPTPDPSSFWHSPPPPPHPHYPKAMMHQVTPCLTPQPVLPPATRLATKAVGVVPPQQQVIYNNKHEAAPPPPVVHRLPHLDLLPSNETIDAALGDILSKPWLPLPLGLKPPSTDSVLSELQRQGISRVPPSCA